ncbi:MAG: hypothetical protein M0Q93_10625 [Terrimicrobiaceae bacterium]|nr:hypothetical protein [Terrimicrobiaceae bacterium]
MSTINNVPDEVEIEAAEAALSVNPSPPEFAQLAKSEILAALDEMEFCGPALFTAAENLSDALNGGEKIALRHFHVAA